MKTRKLKKKASQEARKLHQKEMGDRGFTILLCRKCDGARKLGELERWLRKEIAAAGHSRVQVRTTGCLGPCPDDQLAVAMGGHASSDWKSCWTLNPREDRRKLLDRILARLGS